MDRATRLSSIGAVLAERMPRVFDAVIALLESTRAARGALRRPTTLDANLLLYPTAPRDR